KKPLADSLTASLWTDVKIIEQASPDGIDITIAADERLHEPGVVEGNVDKLRCRRVAEPLRPDGERSASMGPFRNSGARMCAFASRQLAAWMAAMSAASSSVA